MKHSALNFARHRAAQGVLCNLIGRKSARVDGEPEGQQDLLRTRELAESGERNLVIALASARTRKKRDAKQFARHFYDSAHTNDPNSNHAYNGDSADRRFTVTRTMLPSGRVSETTYLISRNTFRSCLCKQISCLTRVINSPARINYSTEWRSIRRKLKRSPGIANILHT